MIRRRAGAALVLLCGLVGAGCGTSGAKPAGPVGPPPPAAPTSDLRASAPGVTADTVTVASHQPLTGALAPGLKEIGPATRAYFDYLNAHGGVHGRRIVYRVADDAGNPIRTDRAVRDLLETDQVFAVVNGLGTSTHQAVADLLNNAHVPDLFVGSGCTCWDAPSARPYTFGWQPDYLVEGKILGRYVADHFPGRKVGLLYQNDAFGQQGVQGVERELPAAALVDKQGYSPTSDSLVAQVSALKQAGAQVVVAFTLPTYTATYALTAADLGFAARLVVADVGADPATVGQLVTTLSKGRASPALLNGIVTDAFLPAATDSANSWIALFRKIHDADPNLATVPFDGNVVYGMSVAYTFAAALADAGPNPTRASLLGAVAAGRLPAGPGLAPFRFAPGVHAGYAGAQLGSVAGGRLSLGGPVEVTDDAAGPVTAYPGSPQAAPPAGIPPGS